MGMGKRKAAALALCLALLTGCGGDGLPRAREMGDMALMRTMGVDAGRTPELLAVTLSSGRRAKGLQGEEEPPLILSAEGASLSGACLAIQGLSDSSVFYGHVDQLLLGETLAARGVSQTLSYFTQDPELGLGAQVWAVRGADAGAAIWSGGDRGVDSRLTVLRQDSELGVSGITRTVGETLTALLEDGAAYLPALTLGADGTLLEAGYAVLKGDALAGWLSGEEARGLELAAGQAGADLLELELPGGRAAVRVVGADTSCVPVFSGDQLTGLELTCRLSLRLEESQGAPERQLLCRHVERREKSRVEGMLARLQQWNADCLGLARRAGRAEAARWPELQRQWERTFPGVPIAVTVEATLR